jgi:hypothetical protein
MRSLKTVSFMTPKSFGVDLNLREWRVGEKNCRSAMALLLLGGCCCKQGNNKEWQHVLTLLQDF